MKQALTKIRLSLSLAVCFLLFSSAPALALFNPLGAACQNNTGAVCTQNAAQEKNNTDPVPEIIAKAARIITVVIGLAAVIMIIIAGISMITSRGNSDAVGKARSRITNSVIGLTIAALAWTLLTFVIDHIA